MMRKSKRGRADSEALPTIEELIENCKRLAEELEKGRKELKREMYECAKP